MFYGHVYISIYPEPSSEIRNAETTNMTTSVYYYHASRGNKRVSGRVTQLGNRQPTTKLIRYSWRLVLRQSPTLYRLLPDTVTMVLSQP